MGHEYDVDIGEYIEGTLEPARAALVEAHLAACERCRAIAADFRTLRSVAGALERRTPPPHVWTRIASRLEDPVPQGWLPWMFRGPVWRLAAAAGVIVALLAAGTWLSSRQVADSRRATAVTTTEVGDAQPATGDPAGVEQVMRRQISHMEGIVRNESSVLPGETQAAYRAGISDIDNALGLAAEPSDEMAQQSLFELLQSKLTLLQEMIALINEMRKGNQEEAARIVSGMEQP